MVWFKVDDTLAFHPKVLEAGNTAMGVWVRAGAWSSQNLTDGFIPKQVAARLGSRKTFAKLINAGLFEELSHGYLFHDWCSKNPTKADVEANRDQTRQRVAHHRKRRLEAVPEQTESPEKPENVTPLVTVSRPDPYQSTNGGEVSPVGGAPPWQASDDAPPQFCLDHPRGTSKPCGACAGYRKHYETWFAQQNYEALKTAIAEGRNNHAILVIAIKNCPLCDDEGYRPNGIVCDHIDRTETAKAGYEMVRAALAKNTEPAEVPF